MRAVFHVPRTPTYAPRGSAVQGERESFETGATAPIPVPIRKLVSASGKIGELKHTSTQSRCTETAAEDDPSKNIFLTAFPTPAKLRQKPRW